MLGCLSRGSRVARSPVPRVGSESSVSSGGVFETPDGKDENKEQFWIEETFGSSALELSGSENDKTAKETDKLDDTESTKKDETDDFIVRRNKRKRMAGTPPFRQEPGKLEVDGEDFKQFVDKLKKNSEQLKTLVRNNPNTQKGIKKTIEDLGYIVRNLARRLTCYLPPFPPNTPAIRPTYYLLPATPEVCHSCHLPLLQPATPAICHSCHLPLLTPATHLPLLTPATPDNEYSCQLPL
ncbi:unnamed protein product [Phaedon cochleariae]|uniref:Uncharacterized protein n=1 Tax=Phaedon cochleariae TaxID=80249 RepID=A0A9N9X351_PHACE|nr:unnamed protein product [Phaedon cochleariae]